MRWQRRARSQYPFCFCSWCFCSRTYVRVGRICCTCVILPNLRSVSDGLHVVHLCPSGFSVACIVQKLQQRRFHAYMHHMRSNALVFRREADRIEHHFKSLLSTKPFLLSPGWRYVGYKMKPNFMCWIGDRDGRPFSLFSMGLELTLWLPRVRRLPAEASWLPLTFLHHVKSAIPTCKCTIPTCKCTSKSLDFLRFSFSFGFLFSIPSSTPYLM